MIMIIIIEGFAIFYNLHSVAAPHYTDKKEKKIFLIYKEI
jgi:hypothetical protein